MANLENDDDCKRIVDEHIKEYGRIDVLVNNASKQITCKSIADIEPENVRSTFHSNITGASVSGISQLYSLIISLGMIILTKFAMPHMKRGGTIVNSTSVTCYKGSDKFLDYSATKSVALRISVDAC